MTDQTTCNRKNAACLPQEEQTVTVTVRTRGDVCALSDDEIREWYRNAVDGLLDPRCGEHEVSVSLTRRPVE